MSALSRLAIRSRRPRHPIPLRFLALFIVTAATSSSAWAQVRGQVATSATRPVQLAPEIVTASRAPQPPEHAASTVRTLDWQTLREVPALTLDGQLRSIPGFSLFRRSDSLSANPTAQGVSLRGLGPSGASRSLVLLDGVPLNDPFGGWVAWSKVPRENLLRVELVPGGGASAWGNAALSGVIQMLGEAPTARTTRVVALAGDYGTRSLEFSHTQPAAGGFLDVSARAFGTDGFSLVAPEHRGPIDIPAWSRHRWLTARWRQPLGNGIKLAATIRGYEEKRGNGTPYQRNATREKFASLAAASADAANLAWSAVAYAQDQSFASTFGAINLTRTTETPAANQFAVPATAFGAAWSGRWRHPSGAQTSFGADARLVRGETREHFLFSARDFRRQRVAGGEQRIGGVFAVHEHPLAATLRVNIGLRADAWHESDGHRRELDRTSGAVLRDERYADREGSALSPSAGVVWQPDPAWRLRASVQRAFRRPTLNELYRPFRVGPNVTEANAALDTEHVIGAEVGGEWTLRAGPGAAPSGAVGQAQAFAAARPRLRIAAAMFTNDFRDAVGNVTIARGPGTFPIVGFVAAGGAGRQRLNLDRIRVRGVEVSAQWFPAAALAITGDFLYNDAVVRRTSLAPGLVGKRVAQVPKQSAAVTAAWQAPHQFTLSPRLRWLGRQFEDDENQLPLGEVVVVDLNVSRPLTPNLELFLTIENLGNARIETGRNAGGLVNVGTPRLAIFGVRGAW